MVLEHGGTWPALTRPIRDADTALTLRLRLLPSATLLFPPDIAPRRPDRQRRLAQIQRCLSRLQPMPGGECEAFPQFDRLTQVVAPTW
jgi:hypothetical protein